MKKHHDKIKITFYFKKLHQALNVFTFLSMTVKVQIFTPENSANLF